MERFAVPSGINVTVQYGPSGELIATFVYERAAERKGCVGKSVAPTSGPTILRLNAGNEIASKAGPGMNFTDCHEE